MEEKTYTFTHSTGPGKTETITVKESDLTQQQKDLLLGELLRRWEDSPEIVKAEFMFKLTEVVQDRLSEGMGQKMMGSKLSIVRDLLGDK